MTTPSRRAGPHPARRNHAKPTTKAGRPADRPSEPGPDDPLHLAGLDGPGEPDAEADPGSARRDWLHWLVPLALFAVLVSAFTLGRWAATGAPAPRPVQPSSLSPTGRLRAQVVVVEVDPAQSTVDDQGFAGAPAGSVVQVRAKGNQATSSHLQLTSGRTADGGRRLTVRVHCEGEDQLVLHITDAGTEPQQVSCDGRTRDYRWTLTSARASLTVEGSDGLTWNLVVFHPAG